MAIKRRNKVNADFSMASMTDVIFLLLIFFMITSTLVVPNAIKVTLPQSAQQTNAKPLTRVTIDADLNYYVGIGGKTDMQIQLEELTPILLQAVEEDPEMYIALYADETIPYKEVVKILDVANQNHFKMILVTRPQ